MKAKEYAALILEGYAVDEVGKVFVTTRNGLFEVLGKLIEARSIKMDQSVIPIYNDIDRKWRNICGIVNAKEPIINLKPSGFAEYTRAKHTVLWNVVNSK